MQETVQEWAAAAQVKVAAAGPVQGTASGKGAKAMAAALKGPPVHMKHKGITLSAVMIIQRDVIAPHPLCLETYSLEALRSIMSTLAVGLNAVYIHTLPTWASTRVQVA